MTEKTCCICFTDSDFRKVYVCKNCSQFTCNDCCESFINFCKKEINTLPTCPEKDCGEHYVFTGSGLISEEAFEDYTKVLFEFLKNKNVDTLTLMEANKNILSSVRNERQKYIDSIGYGAVKLFIDIAFKGKINKIDKKNIKFVETMENKKKCFNIFCDRGVLDKDFNCGKCLFIFCKECEKEKKSGHTCDENELLSIQATKEMIKCPKCSAPVVKSEGCLAMRCSLCKTNFDYRTGKEGGPGNNHNAEISSKIHYSLSNEIASSYRKEIVSLVTQIESMKPKEYSFENIIKKIDTILKTDDINKQDQLKKGLVKSYFSFVTQTRKLKTFTAFLKDIMRQHNTEEKLSVTYLVKVLKALSST